MFSQTDKEIKQLAKEIIDDLSVYELTHAIRCAKRDYYFGTDKNESGQSTRMKNYLSFGASTLFRGIKANNRLPKLDDLCTDNVKQVLAHILSGDGGQGALSLKYLVASYLFYKHEQVSNVEAAKMVRFLLDEVNAQITNPIAVPSEQNKAKLR